MNFILTWVVAKSMDGKVMLRIDDIDSGRTRTQYLDDIFFELDKIEMEPDGGPGCVDEHLKTFSQHHRIDLYHQALSGLREQNLVFNCSCSRRERPNIAEQGYPGTCLHKNLPFCTNETAVRLKNERGSIVTIIDLKGNVNHLPVPDTMTFCVLWRKDNLPAYQLTSVCDDMALQINCIVRGTDLIPSSLFQNLLASQLGLTPFSDIRFLHHALLTDEYGKKLSKSQASTPVYNLSKREILQAFTSWAGWEMKTDSLHDLVDYAKGDPGALAMLDSCSSFS